MTAIFSSLLNIAVPVFAVSNKEDKKMSLRKMTAQTRTQSQIRRN